MRPWIGLCVALLFGSAAYAADPSFDVGVPSTKDPYANYIASNTTLGPAKIPVRSEAVLDLPEGYAFLPEAPARAFMKKLGNSTDTSFTGLVLPEVDEGWFVIVECVESGYVKDDDAKNWNADDLLNSIRQNTIEENITRRKSNIPEIEILGWVETPHYDEAHHRLIWSISLRNRGSDAKEDLNINYRTLALGRNGYVTMTLVTLKSRIAVDKAKAQELLAHLNFTSGKKYADFNASTDHIAEFGLAALIGGVVVKKIGLFALVAAFFVKGAKIIALLAIGALAWFRKRFRWGKPAPMPGGDKVLFQTEVNPTPDPLAVTTSSGGSPDIGKADPPRTETV